MTKILKIRYYVDENLEALSLAAAERITAAVERVIISRGMARIAISGGNTPKRTFELLADTEYPFRARIDWSRLCLYWVDERCVPPDNADSNYRMTREALLSKVSLPEQNIVRIEGELKPEEAAARYESALRNRFRLEGAELPRFDLILLGMGPDGHTASLFPHSEALNSMMHLAVANHVEAKEAWRVTLTWPVINRGDNVLFVIAGDDKSKPLHEVLLGQYEPDTLPSQLIWPESGELIMLLDRAAARLLPPVVKGVGTLERTR